MNSGPYVAGPFPLCHYMNFRRVGVAKEPKVVFEKKKKKFAVFAVLCTVSGEKKRRKKPKGVFFDTSRSVELRF